jgi:HSP20 family protein
VAHGHRDRQESDAPRGNRGGWSAAPSAAWLRTLLQEDEAPGAAGQCEPPMDVIETPAGIEIIIDLPGVPASGVRVLFSQGTLVVAGRKLPHPCADREAAFHLAERSFGRFARAIRLSGAVDAGRATAVFDAGELVITLPRIDERRGRDIQIPVSER